MRELRPCCVRSGNGSWRDLGSGFAGEVEGVIWALSLSLFVHESRNGLK